MLNITKLAIAFYNSDDEGIRIVETDLVEYLTQAAIESDPEQSEFKVSVTDISPEYSDLFLITICFDQKIDGKTYWRKMTVKVHPRFNMAFNCEYNLEQITLEKSFQLYNYLPDAMNINGYLLAD